MGTAHAQLVTMATYAIGCVQVEMAAMRGVSVPMELGVTTWQASVSALLDGLVKRVSSLVAKCRLFPEYLGRIVLKG